MKLVIAIAALTQLLVAVGCTSTRDRTTAKSRISYVVPPQQTKTAGPEVVVNADEIKPRPERVIVGAKQPPRPETVVIAEKEPRTFVTVADRPDDGNIDRALLPPDARAMNDLHQLNHVHMIAGRQGMERGRSEAVRRFGEQLFREHRAHDALVISTARKAGIELYQPPPTELDRQAIARLERFDAAEFDQAFAEEMHIAHDQAIVRLERARPGLQNPDVRSLVDQTIPTLKAHDRIALNLYLD